MRARIQGTAAALAISGLCFSPAAEATLFTVTLGSGAPKDIGPQFGASLAGTVLTYDTSGNTLTLGLKNGGLGVVDEFSLTLNESRITAATFASSNIAGCIGGSNVCDFSSKGSHINGAPAFNDEDHDGFQSAAVTDPFDIGVRAHGNDGLQNLETAQFVYNLTGSFGGVSSFFDIVDPFDESSGTAHLKNVFWVAHVIQLDSPEGSIWIGGVVRDGEVPEPTTLALFGAALAGLGLTRRRKTA